MGLELVRIISQWAGAIAVLALLSCFVTATAAAELARGMVETADDAFQLTRRMAVIGGSCVIVAGFTSTLYWWSVGVASPAAAGAVAAVFAAAGVSFALAARRLCRK